MSGSYFLALRDASNARIGAVLAILMLVRMFAAFLFTGHAHINADLRQFRQVGRLERRETSQGLAHGGHFLRHPCAIGDAGVTILEQNKAMLDACFSHLDAMKRRVRRRLIFLHTVA